MYLPRNLKSIINNLPIAKDQNILEFGSTQSGHLTLEIARKVGPNGSVTVVDVLSEPLKSTERLASRSGMHNVHVHEGNYENFSTLSSLEESFYDGVVMAHVLWRTKALEEALLNAKKLVKKGGFIFLLDWQKGTVNSVGRLHENRLDSIGAQRHCLASGCLNLEKVVENSDRWGYIMHF